MAANYAADVRSGLHGVQVTLFLLVRQVEQLYFLNLQEGAETAFTHATLDEKTAHGECPEGMKEGFMFKMKCGVGAVSSNANRVFRKEGAYDRYDMKVSGNGLCWWSYLPLSQDPNLGVDHTVPDGGQYEGTDFTMPEDHPELERWAGGTQEASQKPSSWDAWACF